MGFSFAQMGNDLYTGKKSFDIIGRRRLWYAIAAAFAVLSIVLLSTVRLNLGIEFRGGSEFTVSGAATTASEPAQASLDSIVTGQVARVTVVGGSSVRVQTEPLGAEETTAMAEALAAAYEVEPNAVTSSFVGPTWGADVTAKALQGLVIFLLIVTAVMALYFRTWSMALAAIIALLNDLVVTVGLYALVGFEVTPASMIGFLTILGYSLYDTVVVFDKVRENTAHVLEQRRVTYAEAANLAVNQTIVRSVNTSVVGILPVASILFVGAFLLGAGTLRDISLALFIGMIASTLSSIFLASPLETTLRMRRKAYQKHTADVLAQRAKDGVEDDVQISSSDVHDRVTATTPGGHLGQGAQPRRRKK
ncbi:preprotein translocase subunit SecF [Salana multivorans]|uniref:Protein-export membrane protein SecF n=1 Tax=Salana multivorans TaxID=120377 RepID=A0A3N2D1I1_9MICO|nr:protein translocase subunit SecF [Salana multivorans]MBN8880999.1 protein translocase subunit SecF [Salana multivorans]OJX94384.1 MAG: protein-export membrane protein SecF [Micrococcales bacterium 73-15]ROR93613.1 preprotein translocase subunit SecF [Salana multivorans]